MGTERSSGSLAWRGPGGKEGEPESARPIAPQESNEEPIRGGNRKVSEQARATRALT